MDPPFDTPLPTALALFAAGLIGLGLRLAQQAESYRRIVDHLGQKMHRTKFILYAIVFFLVTPLAAQPIVEFDQLPKEVRNRAIEVRKSCKELDPEMKFTDMQGIDVLSLKGDGSRDIIVDNEGLCGAHIAGANCSNRGCDMVIYKEISKGQWRKIFDEHLYAKYLVIDWEKMRLQMLIASIWAGDPRCRPNPKMEYTSGKQCNLIVTYTNNKWNWQPIH